MIMSFARRVLATASVLAAACCVVVRAASPTQVVSKATGMLPSLWSLVAVVIGVIAVARFLLPTAVGRRLQKKIHVALGQMEPIKRRAGQTHVDHKLVPDDNSKSYNDDHDSIYDVIIIGAGVVGGSLATVLARQGKRVLVMEAEMIAGDRIVGELLQPFGVESLRRVGLEDALNGFDAQPTYGYGIILNHYQMQVNYVPARDGDPIPEGRGFHNDKLLMKLRAIASQEKNITFREATVTHIMHVGNRITGVRYMDSSNRESCSRAHLTVVADGYASKFRGLLHDSTFTRSSSFAGVIMRNCQMPIAGAGHVILAKPSPVVFYPITPTEVRMLIDFPDDAKGNSTLPTSLAAMKEYCRTVLAPQVPECMRESFLAAVDTMPKVDAKPNRKLDARPNLDYENVVLLGDALNMRHPTTGGGMSVGFSDMVTFADAVKRVDMSNHTSLNNAIRHFYAVHGKEVQVINILADALYGVFKSEGYPELQFGCFQYLAKGGIWAKGPVLFLSGVNRSQLFLLFHFFAVGVYAMFLTMFPSLIKLAVPMPLPYYQSPWLIARMWKALQVFRMCLRIILPLMARENNFIPLTLATIGMRVLFWVW